MRKRLFGVPADTAGTLGLDVLDFRSSALIEGLADAASAAGAAIMRHRGQVKAVQKADGSPVTAADEDADAVLADALRRLMPGVPMLSEERAGAFQATDFDAFVLADPLDGTKEFIAGHDDFTVNIAVVVNGTPVTGIVYAPAHGTIWTGGADAATASLEPGRPMSKARDCRPIRVRRPSGPMVAAVSRSHSDARTKRFLSRIGVGETRPAGSAIKFCYLAQGDVDIYPRFGPTMEWDTAAGHAIVVAAGGVVLTPEGEPFLYAKADHDYRNGPFVAASSAALFVPAAA